MQQVHQEVQQVSPYDAQWPGVDVMLLLIKGTCVQGDDVAHPQGQALGPDSHLVPLPIT